MAWCPKCKNEYREGIKVCADCGCELVEDLNENVEAPLLAGPREYMEEIKAYLEYNQFKNVELKYNEEMELYGLFMDEEDKEQATKLIQVYISEKTKEVQEANRQEMAAAAQAKGDSTEGVSAAEAQKQAMDRTMAAKEEARKFVNYRNNAERAADNQSAAWSLLLVGGVVMIFLILAVCGVFKLNFNVIFYVVMFAVSAIFIIMGFVSMKSAGNYSKVAASEKALKKEIKQWVEENLNAQMVDSRLKVHGLSEEEKYFHRSALLRAIINGKYPDLDQAFLEHYIDDTLYDVVYSEEA